MKSQISIAGRPIGIGHPPYVVAEMSGNHNHDLQRALSLLEAAKASGADAVKLQTYTADTITIDHDGPEFMIEGGLWGGRRLYDLYKEAHTPWDWHEALFRKARELGIAIFSTPFDDTAVELLERLDAPAYKIASFEAVDLPLIRRVARTGRPMIISTGLANETEIGEAIEAARSGGCNDLVILHCVSAYPSPADQINLRTLVDLSRRFDVLPGLSDHTMGTAVSVAAVALGACFIEKHFTLRRADGGVDSSFSLEPEELTRLVTDTREAQAALGQVHYGVTPAESANLRFRRSLYAVADIPKGTAFSTANIRSIRPGFGLPPKRLPELLGQHAARDIKRGEPLAEDMVGGR